MENRPEALPVQKFRDVKTYSIVWVQLTNTIATGQIFLVDKKNRKIWMYQMNHPASDETKRAQRMYESNLKKNWDKQKIGGELFQLMDNHEGYMHHFKVIAHSDSAKEIAEKVYEARILQAELFLRVCKSHSTWATDELYAENFDSI